LETKSPAVSFEIGFNGMDLNGIQMEM